MHTVYSTRGKGLSKVLEELDPSGEACAYWDRDVSIEWADSLMVEETSYTHGVLLTVKGLAESGHMVALDYFIWDLEKITLKPNGGGRYDRAWVRRDRTAELPKIEATP